MNGFPGYIGVYKAYLCKAFSLHAYPVLLRFTNIAFFLTN
jgi:hypothetical protein